MNLLFGFKEMILAYSSSFMSSGRGRAVSCQPAFSAPCRVLGPQFSADCRLVRTVSSWAGVELRWGSLSTEPREPAHP